MSVDANLCPLCLRAEHPGITNEELRTVGATTDKTCPRHSAAIAVAQKAIDDAYRNTRGGFA